MVEGRSERAGPPVRPHVRTSSSESIRKELYLLAVERIYHLAGSEDKMLCDWREGEHVIGELLLEALWDIHTNGVRRDPINAVRHSNECPCSAVVEVFRISRRGIAAYVDLPRSAA